MSTIPQVSRRRQKLRPRFCRLAIPPLDLQPSSDLRFDRPTTFDIPTIHATPAELAAAINDGGDGE